MVAEHVHDALGQVRRLQELILDKRHFRGYSGRARIVSGVLALVGSAVLTSDRVPATPAAHLAGWGVVLALAVVLNYGALAWWFIAHAEVRKNPLMLKPAVDALPALAAGAVITAALVAAGQFAILFGAWMLMYGLAQTAYRHSLPRGVYWTGLIYMACGTLLLLRPVDFTQPWPMGLMFFLGELAGGLCLLQNKDDGK